MEARPADSEREPKTLKHEERRLERDQVDVIRTAQTVQEGKDEDRSVT